MTNSVTPKLNKWPFVLGDLLLVGFALAAIARGPSPMTLWQTSVCLAATAAGAWLCVIPFLREHETASKLREADSLASTVEQIRNLEQIKTHVVNATDQWKAVQDQSTKTVTTAKDLTDSIRATMTEFCAFLKKANESEKNHLKLEIEKLRRGEAEWLQVTVHVLDHVFALNAAAARAGQPGLMAQMDQFQFACRDVVRRMGLVPVTPAVGELFDIQAHQVAASDEPGNGKVVAGILAPGYTFQGQLVRRALVALKAVDERKGPEPQT
jgi:molecular chaperone GrpE (heat shock protein)